MTKTILLADDSVTIQKVVELTFLDEDFRVVAVGDGSDAIARLGEVAPDLVIADVHMPGADGYEVADAVARSRPGTPVLLLVGTFEVFDAERAAAVGATGHLKKPFDSQELLRRVRELLEVAGAGAAPAGEARETLTFAPAPTAVEWHAPPEPLPDLEATPVFEPDPATWPTPAPAASASRGAEPAPPRAAAGPPSSNGSLSDADIDRIARRVAELIGDQVVREVAWEIVPDLAEVVLKDRIRELEASVE